VERVVSAGARAERADGAPAGRGLAVAALLLASSLGAGYVLAARSQSVLHDRMLPWVLSRSLGLAAYVCLCALVVVGTWFRHPWRRPGRGPGPQALLRAHAGLAAATVVLLAGHVSAVALDHYAGVGWRGAFVPWQAHYRPTPTAMGTLALYGIVLVAATAALAGSIARRVWLPVHMCSALVFALCLAHGLLAGSDSRVLWALYAVSGVVVLALQASRLVARPADLAGMW
jgi:hypothetical protein